MLAGASAPLFTRHRCGSVVDLLSCLPERHAMRWCAVQVSLALLYNGRVKVAS